MKDSTLEKFLAAYLFAQKELADVQSAYKRSLENLFVPRCGNTGEFISAYGYAVTKDGEIWYEITEDFSCVGTIGKNGRFYPKEKTFWKLRNLEHELRLAEEHAKAFEYVFEAAGFEQPNNPA